MTATMKWVAVLLLCLIAGAVSARPIPPLGTGHTAVLPGFYVSPSGSDANPGTLAQPFLTPAKCAATLKSAAAKTCYFRAGTYTLAAQIVVGSGESYLGYPYDAAQSAIVDTTGLSSQHGIVCTTGCQNVVVQNLTINGEPQLSTYSALFFSGGFNGIYIQSNLLQDTTCARNKVFAQFFNGSNLYIRGNTISGCAAGSGGTSDTISAVWNTGSAYSGVTISDNVVSGCNRFCVELSAQSGSKDLVHIDRNTFTNWDGGATSGTCSPAGSAAIAAVSDVGPTASAGTHWGNTFAAASGDKTCTWADELAAGNTSVEQNTLSYAGTGFIIGVNAGTEIENNTMTLLTSGVPTSWTTQRSFDQDGGYNSTEWIGSNTINSGSVTGCPGSGTPGYCGLGFNAYGAQPAVHQPSPIYPPG